MKLYLFQEWSHGNQKVLRNNIFEFFFLEIYHRGREVLSKFSIEIGLIYLHEEKIICSQLNLIYILLFVTRAYKFLWNLPKQQAKRKRGSEKKNHICKMFYDKGYFSIFFQSPKLPYNIQASFHNKLTIWIDNFLPHNSWSH